MKKFENRLKCELPIFSFVINDSSLITIGQDQTKCVLETLGSRDLSRAIFSAFQQRAAAYQLYIQAFLVIIDRPFNESRVTNALKSILSERFIIRFRRYGNSPESSCIILYRRQEPPDQTFSGFLFLCSTTFP